jgi:CheY-like chemotaxis protein
MGLWGARILAVAANELDTLHLIRLLKVEGAQVDVVGTAAEVLDELDTGVVPDLLLVDLTIPGLDALALVRHIRTLPPDAGGRLAAASFGPDPPLGAALGEWRSAGFLLHIGKPVERQELLAVVETLTGRSVERRKQTLLPTEWPHECEERRAG